MIRRLAALLLVLLIGSLVLGPAYAISDPAEMMRNPAQEARAEQIGRQLRCLVCQNESIEDSSADLARDLRAIVRQRVAAGDTDAQITAWMVARYGNFVRLRPPFNALTALLWFSPVLAVLVGLGIALLGRARPPGAATAERGRASAHRGADPVMIWLAVAVLAICAMAPVAWALGVHISPRGRAEAAVALHRAQLAELDRDLADGRIAPAEHATALLEVQRRLLAASEMHDAAPGRGSAAPLLVAVVLVPAVAVGLYSLNGHPDMPSMPRAQQLASAEQRAAEEAAMVVQLRQVLAGLDPHSDGRGMATCCWAMSRRAAALR